MPHPVGHLEHALAAFLAPDRVARIEIGHVREGRGNAQRRILPYRMDAGLERAEVAREIEMLVCGQLLIGEYEHGIAVERRFDFHLILMGQGLGEVDIADLGGKGFGNGIDDHRTLAARAQAPNSNPDWAFRAKLEEVQLRRLSLNGGGFPRRSTSASLKSSMRSSDNGTHCCPSSLRRSRSIGSSCSYKRWKWRYAS